MIPSILLGLLLGIFRFNFAENIFKITMPGWHTESTLETILYLLFWPVVAICLMSDISSLTDLSDYLKGTQKLDSHLLGINGLIAIFSYFSGFSALLFMESEVSLELPSIAFWQSEQQRVDRETKHFISIGAFLYGSSVSEPRLINSIAKLIDDIPETRLHDLVSKANVYERSVERLRLKSLRKRFTEIEREDLFTRLSMLAKDLNCIDHLDISYLRLIGNRIGIDHSFQLKTFKSQGLYSDFESTKSYEQSYQHQSSSRNSGYAHTYSKTKPTKGPLEILGLNASATNAQIKSAYRRLVKKHHPDKFMSVDLSSKERQAIETRMQEINDAYSALMP